MRISDWSSDVCSSDLAEDMALVVAPLVAFDAQCHRLGMGAGWYDRSFAFRRDRAAPPWLVGAAFATQQVDSIAAQSWDVRMDAVSTEQQIVPAPSHAESVHAKPPGKRTGARKGKR